MIILQGHKLRVQTLVSRPFIKSMTQIGDGFYEADGLFFEIFNNLRVTNPYFLFLIFMQYLTLAPGLNEFHIHY